MNFPTLLLLTATMSTLVLRSGDRILIEGTPTRQEGIVVFRSGGALFSVPATEVNEVATREANAEAGSADSNRKPLKVSATERERLIKALEQNHAGEPPVPQKLLEEPASEPAAAQRAASAEDEWKWRREARGYQEAIRQSEENLALLHERAASLEGQIRGLLSLGYQPRSFTYETTQLANVREQIPYAELEVERARRAWDQFRDDARRQGVMPGWLR